MAKHRGRGFATIESRRSAIHFAPVARLTASPNESRYVEARATMN